MEERLIKYYQKELDTREIEKVEAWLNAKAENQKLFEDYIGIWESAQGAALFQKIPVKQDWLRVKMQLKGEKSKQNRSRKLRLFVAMAASVALLISMGVVGYRMFLVSEQQIFMASNQLNAQQNQLVLADGTRVTLNADSRLLYPKSFKEHNRKVELEGEAYFEVAKDPSRPFIIEHGNSKTKVLGTKFNLRAFPSDDKVEVAVTEGKVMLSQEKNESNRVILTPNHVGVYHKTSHKIESHTQSVENILSWRTGVLSFKNVSLLKVLRDLKRHYRVDFVINDQQKAVKTLVSATFNKQSLDEVLKELSLVLGIEFQREEKVIHVQN